MTDYAVQYEQAANNAAAAQNGQDSNRIEFFVKQFLGPKVLEWLADDDVIEILIRPTWISTDRLSGGLRREDDTALATVQLLNLFKVLAPLCGTKACKETPIIEIDLPGMEVRFAGLFVGYDGSQSFASLRKPPPKTFSLKDLLEQRVVTPAQAEIFQQWILLRNAQMLVAGKPGSGKTSLMRTLIKEAVDARGEHEHFVVVEDTREIRQIGPQVTYITATPWVPYLTAVRVSLRQRPDRLIVGEGRGGECLDAIKAANVGAGFLMSIHADTPDQAIRMLISRMKEGSVSGFVDPQLVKDGIQTVVTCSKVGSQFRVTAIHRLDATDGERHHLTKLA